MRSKKLLLTTTTTNKKVTAKTREFPNHAHLCQIVQLTIKLVEQAHLSNTLLSNHSRENKVSTSKVKTTPRRENRSIEIISTITREAHPSTCQIKVALSWTNLILKLAITTNNPRQEHTSAAKWVDIQQDQQILIKWCNQTTCHQSSCHRWSRLTFKITNTSWKARVHRSTTTNTRAIIDKAFGNLEAKIIIEARRCQTNTTCEKFKRKSEVKLNHLHITLIQKLKISIF